MLKLLLLLLSLCSRISADSYITAFNVQIFGQSFMNNPNEVDILVKILKRYDLIFFQETRDSSGDAFNELYTQYLQSLDYKYIISSRLGRTDSKEEYIYIYKYNIVKLINYYEYNDTLADIFEREPYIAEWEINNVRFSTIGVHVKPDDAVAEISALVDVYDNLKPEFSKNSIIMGDLNADCTYVKKNEWSSVDLRTDTRFQWLIGDDIDTTTTNTDCAYDRFIVVGTNEFKSKLYDAQIFRFDTTFSISNELTKNVSDHYPIEMSIKIDESSTNSKLSTGSIIGISLSAILIPIIILSIWFYYRHKKQSHTTNIQRFDVPSRQQISLPQITSTTAANNNNNVWQTSPPQIQQYTTSQVLSYDNTNEYWTEHWSEDDQAYYYYNENTGESTWNKPL